ncbi:MAG: hypothetical protein KKA55_07525 [Proteobacteria bacterium]|nr:hypothetical protein [Pseudomonadota bacterium]MBU1595370.1 hypothetical protein [Pseudomonadota bacterium]
MSASPSSPPTIGAGLLAKDAELNASNIDRLGESTHSLRIVEPVTALEPVNGS